MAISDGVDAIPGIDPKTLWQARDARNAAMEMIEIALPRAKAGEWDGAEIGRNFETDAMEAVSGVQVGDFGEAEAIVRACVAGTRFAGFREIERKAIGPADFG